MDLRSKIPGYASILVSFWFLNGYVLRYVTDDSGALGIYWLRRQWLHAHIGGGTLALLLGPVLLWLGLEHKYKRTHHGALAAYVIGVTAASTTALYLAFHTDFGPVVGLGYASLAFAWLIATTFAAIAQFRNMREQYREWLLRSYVLTFAAVMFRVVGEGFNMWGHGTLVEQISAASWLSWSLPVVITEVVIQGKKIFAPAKNFALPRGFNSTL
jgi:hypothetical protein